MVKLYYDPSDLVVLASGKVDPEDANDDNPVIDETIDEVDTFDDDYDESLDDDESEDLDDNEVEPKK